MTNSFRKVVIVTNWLKKSGGAERVTVAIANALVKQSFLVTMVVYSKEHNELANQLNGRVKVIYLHNNGFFISNLSLLKFVLRHTGVVYFASNHRIAVILAFFRLMLGLKFKLVARNISNLSLLMHGKRQFYTWLLKIFYPKVDILIAQSKGMATDLVENFRFTEKQLRVLYNPVNFMSFVKSPKAVVPNIIFVGRLSKEKGLHYMLDALIKLTERGHNFRLTILGDGPLRSELEDKVQFSKLCDRTTFEGFQEDVAGYFSRSNLLLLTSLYEGFPNVMIQANACGIPVVSFDTPFGPSEIIVEGINGYLCEYLSVDDLVNKIELALKTSWDPTAIAETAQRYSADKFAEGLKNIFAAQQ